VFDFLSKEELDEPVIWVFHAASLAVVRPKRQREREGLGMLPPPFWECRRLTGDGVPLQPLAERRINLCKVP
jgi:hypothetical protein